MQSRRSVVAGRWWTQRGDAVRQTRIRTRPRSYRWPQRAPFMRASRPRSFSSAQSDCHKRPRASACDSTRCRHAVFIASPGPGGGGGGGVTLEKPPPRAQRKGKASLDSPIPVRKPPKPIEAAPKPEPPPPPPEVKPEPLPPVVAPVATVAANEIDRPRVIDEPAPKRSESRGPGAGGGVGSGTGTGLGKGDGSGIGEGTGGGMGVSRAIGGGVMPPRLLR